MSSKTFFTNSPDSCFEECRNWLIWNVSCFPPSSNPGPGPQFEPIEILGMNQILQDQTRIFKKKEKFHYSGLDHDDHESDAYQDNGDDDEKDKDQMLAGWLRR